MYDDLYEAYDKLLLQERISEKNDHELMVETQRMDELPALSSMRKMLSIQSPKPLRSADSASSFQKSDGFERMKNCRSVPLCFFVFDWTHKIS
jgi:hypothetical protein